MKGFGPTPKDNVLHSGGGDEDVREQHIEDLGTIGNSEEEQIAYILKHLDEALSLDVETLIGCNPHGSAKRIT